MRRVIAATALSLALSASSLAAPAQGATWTPGIDVSHWQGNINWTVVGRDTAIEFAFIKATEGQTYVDPKYAFNESAAMANGIVATGYHFARPDSTKRDAVKEAQHFVATSKLGAGNLVPALDLEVSGGLSQSALIAWTKAWLNTVNRRLGVRAAIYTSPSFWKTYMGDTTWFAASGYKILWVAHWTADSQPTLPAANWGGNGWTFWQYTSCGKVLGISGCVDRDRYNGADLGPVTI